MDVRQTSRDPGQLTGSTLKQIKIKQLLKTDDDVEIDLDEVLDIEDDRERRGFVKVFLTENIQSIINVLLHCFQKILTDSNSSQEIINVRF